MKSLFIAVGFILVGVFLTNQAAAEVSRSAFRVSSSASAYQYYAQGSCQTDGEGGIKMRFVESDFSIGMDTPKKYLGPFYVSLSVNNTTLTQSEQLICLTDDAGQANGQETTGVVPEKAFLHTRELFATLGTEFGFLMFDVSAGAIGVKGNYYINNNRFDADRIYQLVRVSAMMKFDLFSWGDYGADLSTVSTPNGGDYTKGYIEYTKAALFVRILL